MVLGGWGLSPCSADGLRLGQSDLTEYACIRRNRVGEGEARPTGLIGPVMGSEAGGGAARSPEGEDTAPQAAPHFAIDGGTGGSRLFAPGIVTRRAETARRGGSGPQA